MKNNMCMVCVSESVFPAMPGVGIKDLRNVIAREVKLVGGNRLIISSHCNLNALKVGMRILVTRKENYC